jgi:hypothetical protein
MPRLRRRIAAAPSLRDRCDLRVTYAYTQPVAPAEGGSMEKNETRTLKDEEIQTVFGTTSTPSPRAETQRDVDTSDGDGVDTTDAKDADGTDTTDTTDTQDAKDADGTDTQDADGKDSDSDSTDADGTDGDGADGTDGDAAGS